MNEKLLKYEAIEVKGQLPKEFVNLTQLANIVINAKTIKEIELPTKDMAKALQLFKTAENAFKKQVSQAQQQAQHIKEQIVGLEKAIKDKALELVKPQTKTKINQTTGEVVAVKSHNLTKGIFTYTPKRVKQEIDYHATFYDQEKKMQADQHDIMGSIESLLKPYGLTASLRLHPEFEGPYAMKTTISEPRVGIQHKAIITSKGEKKEK